MDRIEWSSMCIIAFQIAMKHHSEQIDKSGMTYFWHPLRVANSLKGWKLQTIAILHDILEDTSETVDTLYEAGITDKEVLDAIVAITKTKEENYKDYLKRVKNNPLARLVKLADINDNTSVERLSYLPIHKVLKMIFKYWTAMRFLRDIDSEESIGNLSFKDIIYAENLKFNGINNFHDILLNCKEVPDWGRFLTVDSYGVVEVWEGKPDRVIDDAGCWFERNDDSGRWYEKIGNAEPKHFGVYKITQHIVLENKG